jgi:hypothetical protein
LFLKKAKNPRKQKLQSKNEFITTPQFTPINEKKEPNSRKKLSFELSEPSTKKDYTMNNDYYRLNDSSINNKDFSKLEYSPDNISITNYEKDIEKKYRSDSQSGFLRRSSYRRGEDYSKKI